MKGKRGEVSAARLPMVAGSSFSLLPFTSSVVSTARLLPIVAGSSFSWLRPMKELKELKVRPHR